MDDSQVLIQDLNNSYGWELEEAVSSEKLEALVAEKIEWLIQKDFNKLIALLYRIDVSESRLRLLLQENQGKDSPALIARLIIERIRQKIETRRKYSSGG